MATRFFRALVGLLSALFLLTLAACSSSGDSEAGNGSKVIEVGLMCSCGGAFAQNEIGIEQVYLSWVKSVNESGGINGHQVHLTIKNDAGVPATAISNAKALVSDHVDAIADLSIVDPAWADIAKDAQIPVVGTGVHAVFETNPDFYSPGGTPSGSWLAYLRVAKDSGVRHLGIVYCVESPTCAAAPDAMKKLAPTVGVPIGYVAGIRTTDTDYTAQCLAARSRGMDGLFIIGAPSEIATVARVCDRQGYHPTYVIPGLNFNPGFLTDAGLKLNTWMSYSSFPYNVDRPFTKEMTNAVRRYYPKDLKNPDFGPSSETAWVSGILLEHAVKAGGLKRGDTPTADEIVKGLESLHGDTLDGWSEPLSFPKGELHPSKCWFTARIQNGTFTVANDGQPTCP